MYFWAAVFIIIRLNLCIIPSGKGNVASPRIYKVQGTVERSEVTI
jgi:hypothetical protein